MAKGYEYRCFIEGAADIARSGGQRQTLGVVELQEIVNLWYQYLCLSRQWLKGMNIYDSSRPRPLLP